MKEKEKEEMELEKEEEREPEKIFRQFCAIAFGFTSPTAPPVINVAFFTGLALEFVATSAHCTARGTGVPHSKIFNFRFKGTACRIFT